MFIGEWNKSVILTYIGMGSAVLGMYFACTWNVYGAFAALIVSGVCDLFDGAVARKCKRNEAQKLFGVQLDSLVDVINFLAFPTILGIFIGMNRWYHLLVLILFCVCGIARLAFFNISSEGGDAPVKYYRGLPVTFTALILPIIYLLHLCLAQNVFTVVYTIAMLLIALLNILDIKIAKPKGMAYPIFALLAVGMLVVYLVVL